MWGLSLLTLALEGRKESVTTPEASADQFDFLALFTFPLGRGVGVRAISAPFARGNLHLVIPQNGTQPLILRYSIVNLYYSRRFYTSESAFVKSEIKAFIHLW